MANLNKVLLMGKLTREPQSKALPQNGTPVCDLGMAVNRRYKTQSGEEREDVVYVDLTAYGYQADYCMKNMTKGSTVYVEGHLRFESWQDKDTGKNRSKLRVIVDTILHLERKNSQYPEQQAYPPMGYGQQQSPYAAPAYGQPLPNYGYLQQPPAYPPPQQPPYQPPPQPQQPVPQQPQAIAQPARQPAPQPQQPAPQQPAPQSQQPTPQSQPQQPSQPAQPQAVPQQPAPQPQPAAQPQQPAPQPQATPQPVAQPSQPQAAPSQPAPQPQQPSQPAPSSAPANEEVVDDMPF